MNTSYVLYLRSTSSLDIRTLCQLDGIPEDAIKEALTTLGATRGSADPFARFKKAVRRPGRPVRVVSYQPKRSYVVPLSIPKVGEVFDSLTDFADAIGSSSSNLSTALTEAHKTGKSSAFARGVEFGYVDLLPLALPPSQQAERHATQFGEILTGTHQQVMTTLGDDREKQRLVDKHLALATHYGSTPYTMAKVLMNDCELGTLTEPEAMELVARYTQSHVATIKPLPAIPPPPTDPIPSREQRLQQISADVQKLTESAPKPKLVLKIAGPRPDYQPPSKYVDETSPPYGAPATTIPDAGAPAFPEGDEADLPEPPR